MTVVWHAQEAEFPFYENDVVSLVLQAVAVGLASKSLYSMSASRSDLQTLADDEAVQSTSAG